MCVSIPLTPVFASYGGEAVQGSLSKGIASVFILFFLSQLLGQEPRLPCRGEQRRDQSLPGTWVIRQSELGHGLQNISWEPPLLDVATFINSTHLPWPHYPFFLLPDPNLTHHNPFLHFLEDWSS